MIIRTCSCQWYSLSLIVDISCSMSPQLLHPIETAPPTRLYQCLTQHLHIITEFTQQFNDFFQSTIWCSIKETLPLI